MEEEDADDDDNWEKEVGSAGTPDRAARLTSATGGSPVPAEHTAEGAVGGRGDRGGVGAGEGAEGVEAEAEEEAEVEEAEAKEAGKRILTGPEAASAAATDCAPARPAAGWG